MADRIGTVDLCPLHRDVVVSVHAFYSGYSSSNPADIKNILWYTLSKLTNAYDTTKIVYSVFNSWCSAISKYFFTQGYIKWRLGIYWGS